jgi:site-specific DNA-methyltransferase (adenine-specific)
MRIVLIQDVVVSPNRQRREFDLAEINQLGESIKQHGLLNPITIREEFDKFILVAGERRLRAIKDLNDLGDHFRCDGQLIPENCIPVTSLGELNEIQREEAELEENIRRLDLTWQERATATARLAALRNAQARVLGKPTPAVAAISLEVRGSPEGVHHETTRREIILAKHMDKEEVKNAKSLDDAWKTLRRSEDETRRTQLAASVGRTYSAASAHRLLHEDSLAWMTNAEPNEFDVICTDPPYGINADTFGDSGGAAQGAHFYKDDYETWKNAITILAREGYRITKPEAHLYAFCDITRFEEFKYILEEAGWSPFRTPIVWHKPNGNRVPWPTSGPQRKYELILYAIKGKKPVTRIYPDLVSYSADANLGHNAQKPIDLYTDLLRRSVAAGDSILDPFAGSCPLVSAATELKCKATCIEIDAAAYAIGVERLNKTDEQPELAGLL